MQPATGPETESGEVFIIALPRIVIDFDSAGSPSMLGIKLQDLERLTGASFGSLQLNKFYVDWMTNANVQHIELRQTGNGVAFMVNGKPMPHIAWNDQSLQKVSDVAALMQVPDTELIAKFLPIVRRLGLDVVLTFPRQPGVAEIALMDSDEALKVQPVAADEPASAIVRFEVKYDTQGVPGVLGITASDLSARGISAPLAMDTRYINMLQSRNIQNMELKGQGDGLFLYINGEPLPNIVWDDTFLTNAADLYVQMNPDSPYIDVAKQLLPLVNNADVNVLVHFPRAANAAPIAARMH
jgi:hypothetical protein